MKCCGLMRKVIMYMCTCWACVRVRMHVYVLCWFGLFFYLLTNSSHADNGVPSAAPRLWSLLMSFVNESASKAAFEALRFIGFLLQQVRGRMWLAGDVSVWCVCDVYVIRAWMCVCGCVWIYVDMCGFIFLHFLCGYMYCVYFVRECVLYVRVYVC